MKRPAVFLDRDGTIIQDTGYVDSPDKVRLTPGAASAIRRFREAGYRVVLVSNQSGVARGLFDEKTLERVHGRVETLLKTEGASLDAAYYCPYLDGPEATVERFRMQSELRKPAPGMLLKAANENELDLATSWMIGDSERDVEAGRRAGCRTILLAGNGSTAKPTTPADFVARDLPDAAHIVENAAAEPGAQATGAASPPVQPDFVKLMTKLSDQLDQSLRADRQRDFSVWRFLASLLQMLSIVAAVWAAFALLNDHPAAGNRFLLAIYLQLGAVGAWAIDRPG